MKRMFLALATIAVLFMAFLQGCGAGQGDDTARASRPAASVPVISAPVDTAPPPPPPFVQENFVNRRTINYVSSDPANNSLLATPPDRVTIYFSKALGAGSFIEVTREEGRVVTGQVVVAPDNRSMYVTIAAGITGNYKVKYAAYFSSGYYEEGSFGFSVNIP